MATINNLISYELNGVKESFANWISNISPADTPFTSLTGKEAVKNKYFQWQEDWLDQAKENAFAEGEDATSKTLLTTKLHDNVTQILRKVVQVSDTANSLAAYGRGTELQYQIEKASKELKRDIEWAFLNNNTSADVSKPGVPTTNAQIRKTKGFFELVAAKDAGAEWESTAIVHRAAKTSGTVTEGEIFDITESLYLAGAKATHIMFHPKHAQFFSGLMEKVAPDGERMRMFDGSVDTKVNKYVSCLIDPLGQRFCLIPNRFMPADLIYFFNPSDWTQMIFRPPVTTQLAKNGNYEKYMIEVELGLRHRNRFASGILEVVPVAPANSITGNTVPGTGLAGTTVLGTTLFSITGYSASDFDFAKVGTTAGVTVSATTGDTTLTAAVTGDVQVKATGKAGGAADGVTATATISGVTAAAPVVTGVTITAPAGAALTQKIGATGTATATVQGTGAVGSVTWSSATPTKVSIVAGTGAWKVENAANVGDKVKLTATSVVDNTKKAEVEITVAAPDLTGFTLAATPTALTDYPASPKLALTGTAATTVTVTPVPAKAVLGAVTAPSSSAAAATSVVGSGATANQIVITGVAPGSTNVEVSVAGVTAKQTIAVTVS